MKQLSILLVALCTSMFVLPVAASQHISLQPGSTITIEPDVETEISCGGNKDFFDFYCRCSRDVEHPNKYYALFRVTFAGSSVHKDRLAGWYYSSSDCESIFKSHPACQEDVTSYYYCKCPQDAKNDNYWALFRTSFLESGPYEDKLEGTWYSYSNCSSRMGTHPACK